MVIHNAAGNFISPTESFSATTPPNTDIVLKGTGFLTSRDVGKRMIAQDAGGVFLAITTKRGQWLVVPSACAKSRRGDIMMKSLGRVGQVGIRMNCIATWTKTEGAIGKA